MKNILEFKTLTEFTDYFSDEETCVKHFAAIRFANGEYCPHCGHNEIYTFSNGKRYRCAKCKQDFTIRTGTVFGESKLPLRKWFMAIYLLSTSNKGISSVQLAKQVGVTQKTGWFIDHRIRSAMKQNGGQLFGRIEADETYIGGAARNMHKDKKKNIGTGGKGKTPIIGVVQRGGDVKAVVAENLKHDTLASNIADKVQAGSFVYTDEHRGYNGLHRMGYLHGRVRHSRFEFVVGDAHTNTIESFWALFKRGYHGIYHWMSKKHMQRYVDEFTFRFNRRTGEMQDIFSQTILNMAANPQLPYKTLTAKTA
jgi:transposase-like protein